MRLLIAALVVAAIVVGIPLAVAYQWPAVALSATLWAIILIIYRREIIARRRAARTTPSTSERETP